MSGFRKYADLDIGSQFPEAPARYLVTAEVVDAYRAITAQSLIASDSDAQRSVDAAEAPPTLAAVYIRPAQNALRGPPGGVHAKQQFAFHAPVRIGDVLETTLVVQEKYERKGRNYLVSETRTVNQRGILVTTSRITQIWGQE